ncbi:phosphate regulon sensor histidine kinase PhoR [Xylophilus sp. GOD-11R]|uniref:phosphate regulon sensor histidine kinase PhoR n=1 Tax=Xylophilus sp. GOD-11R TaxID=3089814 RepID=UPI00298BFA6D|nr:phosphate regulon sensor histidine kinase PhoR [Xylophilus sp. GOD-11R]WPB58712.1 phosphate regulon sensor histidine kinase PhoR [Xylophilus sp. GOD-11R]
MIARLLMFFAWQAAGLAVGAWLATQGPLDAGLWHTAFCLTAAMAVSAWLAFFWDLHRARRLLVWLRNGSVAAEAPVLRGVWGEVVDRSRRRARESERALRQSQARLDDILSALQASPNGVVLLDAGGHIEWCNQMATEHFGIEAQRDLMQSIGNLVRDPAFVAYWSGGDFSSGITMPGSRSTGARPVRLAVNLHRYGEGRTLILSRDVTAVEQAEAMRRDFVANVSHEIRTPLTVLTGFVETLQTLPLETAERAHYLGLMAQQASRMQGVVSDLLTLSRLEGSPPPGRTESMPLALLLSQCEQEGQALSTVLGRRHTLVFPAADGLGGASLLGAPQELRSALSNLVGNAIRYTPAGGTISVAWTVLDGSDSARGTLGEGEISVRDTGPGVASEHIPRLTERFYRVDRSRSRETGGTGLGLAIVKHVMQRHGGRLRIVSQVGAGSTFSLVFPAMRVRVEAAAAAQNR